MDSTTTHRAATPIDAAAHEAWETKRLLILGTTYPAYSTKYTELVCTGAIEEDTKRMVRVHPVPKRYLDEDQAFKNFQRVEARVQPNRDDGRPESVRIDFRSLKPLDELSAKDHEARRSYIEQSPSLLRSVEELQDENKRTGLSLGAIVPKTIDDVTLRKRTPAERAQWFATEKRFMDQKTLPLIRAPKRIDFPEVEFQISWTCNDVRCRGHQSGLKSWGIHQLYRKLRHDPKRDEKTKAQLLRAFDLRERDVFFFLGTFHNHRTTFGLMDAYTPPRRAIEPQLGLFAALGHV